MSGRYPFGQVKKIIDFENENKEISFQLVHDGCEGQLAWAKETKGFYIEIVEYLNGDFAYHVEKNERYVADSRAANGRFSYYKSFEMCYNAALNQVSAYKIRRQNGKV